MPLLVRVITLEILTRIGKRRMVFRSYGVPFIGTGMAMTLPRMSVALVGSVLLTAPAHVGIVGRTNQWERVFD